MHRLFLASDHAGFPLKCDLHKNLKTDARLEITDLGTHDEASVDYPDYGYALAHALRDAPTAKAIAICGSGIGISIAANRYAWVRAALVNDEAAAKLSRQHNDANILVLGGRFIGLPSALACVNAFLATAYEGGRHQHRLDKLSHPPQSKGDLS